MKTKRESLRKIVSFLNNPDEEGGFWLPNIQRPFVWSEDQIYRLFDSIMREYPISTLLIWKTKSEIRHRKFIDIYHENLSLTDLYVPEDIKKKCLVLDGQQRLQALFIGLKGSYESKELCFDILSGEVIAPNDIKYKFEFLSPSQILFPWIRMKDIVFSPKTSLSLANHLIDTAGRELESLEKERISENISLIFKTFHTDEGISYQELDSIENPDLYREDDVVEIFIRANSGGTRLGKSDLLFSLLNATWDYADQEMEELLDTINRFGYAITRDFVLKTCLTLLNQGARYEVTKFRKNEVREEIEREWHLICESIEDVLDFVRGKTYIHCDKAMPSYLVLIPLIYLRYHYPTSWKQAKDLDTYILRTSLTGAMSGVPDQLIDDCVREIKETEVFNVPQIFDVIKSKGRSLELTEDRLWNIGYGSSEIHLLFNLWYRNFNYIPSYVNNLPQVDHIFPQSALKKVKIVNPNTGRRDLMKYREAERNQLANCMLLTQEENGAGGKSDILPEEWFADKSDAYLEMHLIPNNSELWKMDRYEDFIFQRKILIKNKLSGFLALTTQST